MKKRKSRAILALALVFCAALSPFKIRAGAECLDAECEAVSLSPDVRVSSRIFELLFGKEKFNRQDGQKYTALCAGGDVFGIRIKEDHVTVVDSRLDTRIESGDTLLSVGGRDVKCIEDVKAATSEYAGGAITLKLWRDGEEILVDITPSAEGDEYKLGLSLRDSAAGIGTVTFYDSQSGFFGGLGHGICDNESGEVLGMVSGTVTGVVLGGVKKGAVGSPGELCGVLTGNEYGTLYSNTDCGVFGVLDEERIEDTKALKIGHRSEVHEGDAKIISTVKNGKKCEFAVKIFDVDKDSHGTKSFKIKVTDKTLIGLTGGIVRGMSGSPIIQDGKLVGAVTHVMVADPTEGYGIFIENMLNAAQGQIVPKAA